MPFAQEKMGFDRPPKLFLRQDQQTGDDPMGKTGFYDPQNEAITIYISNRHPKDIMRSLAHELQHHTQKCNGDFDNIQNMGEQGYAQADPHLRTMEIQAYQASIVFRDWEDSLKETIYYEHLQKGDKSSMSTKNWKNGELKSLLSEAWGFGMNLDKLNESKEQVEEAFGKQDTGGSRRKPHGAGEREKQEDCDVRTDPTCVPEPGEKAVEKSIASRMDEDEEVFAPNHYCVHHGGVQHNGSTEMAEAISHNYSKKLGRVTHYNMKLSDGTILENIAVEDIQVTNASLAEGHGGHAAKRDDDDDELDEGGRANRGENSEQGEERRMGHADRVRESVKRLHSAGYTAEQIKESLTSAFNKAKKG